MSSILEAESTLTDRYQTTVPESVRKALKLDKRDKLHYSIRSDGAVVISRAAEAQQEDPALAPFLDFLARDFAAHPEKIKAIDTHLSQRIQNLVGEIDVDLDAPLSDADE